MSSIIHLADLHLSRSEQEYSLAVFDEVLELCRRTEARMLLIAGDLFDTYPDAVALAPEVAARCEKLPAECEIVAIPGNHEALRSDGASIDGESLGRITWVDTTPFSCVSRPEIGLEIIAVPFQPDYAEYVSWEFPPPDGAVRIALMHGTLSGMWFSGLDESEDETAAIDADLFRRCGASYAALGHIHTARTEQLDGCYACYPGSARVWRRGETGARTAQLLDLSGGVIRPREAVTLETAGRYHELELPVGIDPDRAIEDLDPSLFGSADYLEISLTGLVESQDESARLSKSLRQRLQSRVRRLEINTEQLEPLSGFGSLPLARRFLDHWHERRRRASSEEEVRILLEARRIALGKIKQRVEGRR